MKKEELEEGEDDDGDHELDFPASIALMQDLNIDPADLFKPEPQQDHPFSESPAPLFLVKSLTTGPPDVAGGRPLESETRVDADTENVVSTIAPAAEVTVIVSYIIFLP